MPSESEPTLRQMLLDTFEAALSSPNGLPDLYLMKATLLLATLSSSHSSKLEEMERRLSVLEAGSKQQEAKQTLTGSRTIFQAPQYLC